MSKIQETHDNKEKVFWYYLSPVYERKTLPFSKFKLGKRVPTKENEIETEYVELMNQLVTVNEKTETTNYTEIKGHISKLKSKKSYGFDAVSNFMIKRIPPTYIRCLVKCFNTWLSEYKYPGNSGNSLK